MKKKENKKADNQELEINIVPLLKEIFKMQNWLIQLSKTWITLFILQRKVM